LIEESELSVIVPCYNEESALSFFVEEMEKVTPELLQKVVYYFIDDGSSDQTLSVLKKMSQENNRIFYLSFSRNFGKEAAILAGLEAAKGSFVAVMDADLQDPPKLLPQMFAILSKKNCEIVGTRRVNRNGEPLIRSVFACLFYRLVNRISDTEMVDGVRDFRLMTRQVVDSVLELKEVNRFSKGLFSWVGFKTEYVSFENRERIAGKSSWNFWTLFKYSIEGIINFSEAPLNIATFVGVFSCLASVVAMFYYTIVNLLRGNRVPGWPSLVCIILFIGGMQLFCLGIIGKYVGKIFIESKRRPVYIVKEGNLSQHFNFQKKNRS